MDTVLHYIILVYITSDVQLLTDGKRGMKADGI